MTQEQQIKIKRIIAALKRNEEVSGLATPGPWTLGNENNSCAEAVLGTTDLTLGMSRESPYTSQMQISRNEMLANIHFVMHARTIAPLACLSLRIAIEGLMDIANQRPPHPNFQNAEAIEYGQEDGKIFARAALESICDQWPEV